MATRAAAHDPQVEKLRLITDTAQLVQYLHTELDWPVEVDDVDDAFFDWDPAELHLSEDYAGVISSIKQLRPLADGQPWGIFFVEFDRKRLPIVALRRLLNSLAIKRRASAKKGGGYQTWHARDLLFVSSFGEAGHREIALAHFTDESEHGDLPVLRVLGWDEDDTTLQLGAVAATLRNKLRWPARTEGAAAQKTWREQWASAFTLQYRQAINDAKSLALALAVLAKRIRVRANDVLKAESERGHLRKLHQAFKDNLIADLTPDGFADMFAQTIAYGLFTAQVSRGSGALVADNVVDMVPSTNPFLRDLLNDFLTAAGRARQRDRRVDFDELGINDVVETLRHAPMEDILRSFNSDRPGEDPVIHFYEDFLKAYDKKMRAKRGVFYTPRPVVQFIVRSVHEILQTEFGIEDGLASTITWGEMRKRRPELALPRHTTDDMLFLQVLDPATGTGTFLVEIIDLIYAHMRVKWAKQGWVTRDQIKAPWNDYVRHHLLPRLHGFELMMAPYAIAHMKIGLKLVETDYAFPADGPRVNVFLTNALQPAQEVQRDLEGLAPMLAHEANAANLLKARLAVTVVVGNPPYSGISGNMFPWIDGLLKGQLPDGQLVASYYRVDGKPLGEKKLWLQDDYVKFIRLGQWRIECSGVGVLGYITNHGYLDNPTFRGMRQCLMNTFGRIDVIDLHGNSKKKEKAPDGTKDENVFDIEQGVAIGLMRAGGPRRSVSHRSLWGRSTAKYEALAVRSLAPATEIVPAAPFYVLSPQDSTFKVEYQVCWPPSLVFKVSGVGAVTARDSMTVDFEQEALWERLLDFAAIEPETARVRYRLGSDARDWKVTTAQADVRATGPSKALLTRYLYRPFDYRFTYFTGTARGFYASPCERVMKQFLGNDNVGIALSRTVESGAFEHVHCTSAAMGHHSVSLKEVNYAFPLWLISGQPHKTDLHDDDLVSQLPGRVPNLSPTFIAVLRTALGLSDFDWQPEKRSAPLHAEKVFHYVYAVLHSPSYRQRYAGFLRADFPRIPIPGSRSVFDALAVLGEQLVQWHLLEHPTALAITATSVPAGLTMPNFVGTERKLLKVAEKSRELADLEAVADGPLGTVFINPGSGFAGVRQAVWQHTIGGYQVLHKWLDDRRKAGRSLSEDDIAHWRRVYAALDATQRLMQQTDEAIVAHGGWPAGDGSAGAFSLDHQPPDPVALAADVAARPKGRRKSVPAAQAGFGFDGGS